MKNIILSWFLVFLIFSCGSSDSTFRSEVKPVNNEIEINSIIEKEIEPYRNELKDSMNVMLSKTRIDFIKSRPNGNLNNLIADIVFKAGMRRSRVHSIAMNNTICLLNYGGLRAPINQGAITIGSCFEVMPFENEIVIAKLNKEQVKEMVSVIRQAGGHPISNAKLFISEDDYDLMVGSSDYLPEFLYVITSDYLYNGGDNMSFFKGTKVIKTGLKIRDALIDFFFRNPVVENIDEERIRL